MGRHTTPDSLLPLTPAIFHILLVLADGEKHGYSIMQEVDTLTEGQMTLATGTLYRSIKKLLQDGLIQEVPESARPPESEDDERRRYYRLTDFGRRVVSAEARRLSNLVNIAQRRRLLGDI